MSHQSPHSLDKVEKHKHVHYTHIFREIVVLIRPEPGHAWLYLCDYKVV